MAATSLLSALASQLIRSTHSCHLRRCPFHPGADQNEAVVISERKLAQQMCGRKWKSSPQPYPSLVLVGENPASHSCVLNKIRAAAHVGINSETIVKPASISQEELLNLINKLNNDENVDGLLVQLTLPERIDERRIRNAVSPNKDIDGFHVINVGQMFLDQYSMLSATLWGVWEMIQRTGIPTLGKNVVGAGRSEIVGMPIAMLLHTDGVYKCPVGIPNLIIADMIKEGAAVMVVGINRIQDPITSKPKLVGDVDFEEVKKNISYITPVPGGGGPKTVAMLMKNAIIAVKKVLRPEEQEMLKSQEFGVATN
ncbi:Bifunctional methylenetetrahydrofolate dehydrogenase/cyclohydrolase, mitochondrial [Heterocephalus glaber]|uniref:methenyltetrahydrofolate cyclohydrolase n=1 Tax=Heterocephalus glaber TaxID=10181 RepID=G5APG3_HETGA|nr:Bifunctional methylenetetrahydrofolate dehydrogenase/cyclohydrolase, mitochondrial [Heterocephalus glaber]